MRKFQDKYRIPSARWYLWDYGSPAWYFVTICTKQQISFFGEIIEVLEPYAPVEMQNLASLRFSFNDARFLVKPFT